MLKVELEDLKKWGILNKVIREKIIDDFIKDIDYSLFENDLLKIKEIISNKSLIPFLDQNNITKEEHEKELQRNLIWTKWCVKKFQEEIPNYYLERKGHLDKVIFSLLRVKNKDLSLELYLRLKEDEESFQEIAFKFSECRESKQGGLIGPIEYSKLDHRLIDILKKSDIGNVNYPIFINPYWTIIRVEKFFPIILDNATTSKLSLELGERLLNRKIKEIKKKIC